MLSLKGETTVYIQKMENSEQYFFKIFKELLILNILLFLIFLVTIFFIMPSFKSASIFLLPFLAILLLNSLILIAYRFNLCSNLQNDLIVRNFTEHSRVINDIAQNFQHEPEIKYIMEVLLVGCDITDKQDLIKIKKLTYLLKKEMSKNNNMVAHIA